MQGSQAIPAADHPGFPALFQIPICLGGRQNPPNIMSLAWMIIPWSYFLLGLKVIPTTPANHNSSLQIWMAPSCRLKDPSNTALFFQLLRIRVACGGHGQERKHQKLLMSLKHETLGPGLNLHQVQVPKLCRCRDKHILHQLSACSWGFSGFGADRFCTLCSEQEQFRHSQLSSSLTISDLHIVCVRAERMQRSAWALLMVHVNVICTIAVQVHVYKMWFVCCVRAQ